MLYTVILQEVDNLESRVLRVECLNKQAAETLAREALYADYCDSGCEADVAALKVDDWEVLYTFEGHPPIAA